MPFFTSFTGKILSAPGLKLGPKIFQFIKTFTSSVQAYSLSSDLVANGWDEVTPVQAIITVNSGVYVWSDNISVPAFNTGYIAPGSTISIVNNGYIIGRGGNGANAPTGSSSGVTAFTNGSSGGNAINLNYPVSITNNSYIAGGGGGGAGVRYSIDSIRGSGGGGAGGGSGGGGVAGGSIGATGSNSSGANGASGGRILPGTGGAAYTGGGAGGGGGGSGTIFYQIGVRRYWGGAAGGGGGGWGASGGQAYRNTNREGGSVYPGPGGSSNNVGTNGNTSNNTPLPDALGGSGGSGGKAVNLNGYSVTWIVTGTRYGAIS